MRKLFPVLLFLLPLIGGAQPGNLFIQSFTPADYRNLPNNVTSPQNWDIIQDQRGIIYIANTSVVMEYDGVKFSNVDSTENSLGIHSLAKDDKGRIYFGGSYVSDRNYLMGFIAPDATGKMTFQNLDHLLPQDQLPSKIQQTFYTGEGIAFVSPDAVYVWNGKKFTIHKIAQKIFRSFCINKRLCLITGDGLLQLFQNGNLTLLLEPSDKWNGNSITCIIPMDTSPHHIDWWICTDRSGIYRLKERQFIPVHSDADDVLHSGSILSGIRINDNNFAIGTRTKGIILLDSLAKVVRRINDSREGIDNQVNGLYYDDQGGLWAALSRGIARIEYPSPITSFDFSNGLRGIVYATLKDGNDLWVGTNYGLFHADANSAETFIAVPEFSEAWCIRKIDGKLWVADKHGLYVSDGSKFRRLLSISCNEIQPSTRFPGKVFVGALNGIIVMDKFNGEWKQTGMLEIPKESVTNLAEDDSGNLWATYWMGITRFTFHNGFSFTPDVYTFGAKDGLRADSMQTIEVYHVQSRILFGSFRGLYYFDEKQKRIKSFRDFGEQFGNRSREAFELTEDSKGNIWLGSETVNGKLIKQDGHYVWDTTELMRMPRLSTWSIFVDDKDVVWIGTEDGLFRYDPSITRTYLSGVTARIRKVATKDSTIFYGSYFDSTFNTAFTQPAALRLSLPYRKNDMSFDCAAPMFDSRGRIEYSYRLEGLHTDWSPWSYDPHKEFTNLREGDYIFHVKARDVYGHQSREAAYAFSIAPPWHRTWWAFLIYLVLLIIGIRAIIELNQRRLIDDKKRLAKKVLERTEVITNQKKIIEEQMQKVEKKSAELEDALETLKKTQSQLLLSEKLASVGQLTAGVAHEINNPINFVTGNINPLKRNFESLKKLLQKIGGLKTDGDAKTELAEIDSLKKEMDFDYTIEESEKLLSGIEEGSRRTAAIVKGLRQFSRIDEDTKKLANINEGIESTLLLLQNKLKFQNIEVIPSFGDIPQIHCFPGQLNQVFMNLLTNAIDAIGSNGKIFITTALEGDRLKISVRDTGQGMPEEVKKKIFDPFFTTKEVGKGTGLGLSISYGIIEKHNGTIEVRSEPGKGTEFIILLPL